jgi:hypothetical protein
MVRSSALKPFVRSHERLEARASGESPIRNSWTSTANKATSATVLSLSRRRQARARALLYLRVSTKEQAGRGGEADGYSIPTQREACLRKAQSHGAVVIEEFIDAGESARSADRPELQRMLRVIAAGDADLVIVHKVDRLARNRLDDLAISLALEDAGVQLVFVH